MPAEITQFHGLTLQKTARTPITAIKQLNYARVCIVLPHLENDAVIDTVAVSEIGAVLQEEQGLTE